MRKQPKQSGAEQELAVAVARALIRHEGWLDLVALTVARRIVAQAPAVWTAMAVVLEQYEQGALDTVADGLAQAMWEGPPGSILRAQVEKRSGK